MHSPRASMNHLSSRSGAGAAFEADLWRRDGCVSCDSATPQCNCSAGEKCVLTSRTCNQCPAIQCIKSPGSSSKSLNPGAIAGPIVAVLVFASLGLFWWMRRKKRRDLQRLEGLAERARKAEAAGFHLSQGGSPPASARSRSINSVTRDSLPQPPPSAARARSPLPPAPVNAEYYDENGATIRVYNSSRGTIDLDKSGNGADPFSDRQSISTMGSGGTANIIPIQYIPPSKSDDALSNQVGGTLPPGQGRDQSAAARKLDEARQNLFHPRRPARAPDLDLRLTVPGQAPGSSLPPSAYDQRSPAAASSNFRDSYLSGNSAAPSYWSGQSDVHLDAPKIVTSKQVHIGRLHQAEVVQFGKPQAAERRSGDSKSGSGRLSPVNDDAENPFNRRDDLQTPSALSPTGSFQTGEATIRTLTPMSRRFDEEEEEGLRSAEPSSAGTGDLRFSMGSLAYRDSVSTVGTGNFLASAPNNNSYTNLPPPLPINNYGQAGQDMRGSVGSSKSFADSVLGAFPMIPPNADGRSNLPSSGSGGLPQSTSAATLDHASFPHRSIPARANYNTNINSTSNRTNMDDTEDLSDAISIAASTSNTNTYGGGGGKKRPETQASVADSFLGSFPFLPPSNSNGGAGDIPDLPNSHSSQFNGGGVGRRSEMNGTGGAPGPRGVSTTSDGLGGFDWRRRGSDDDAPVVPPLPSQARR